eukprot:TRINITY_DN55681_c0_g1_i1.p1 TRINITY_DN55681_c0_g1~~TRINITY_DN55681_c0_g1_i1.p1  ORF type:complete len:303 (+),score=-2.91 TRINITY_DN55681_c0_g1_i1:441-1349(+)
MSSQDVINMIKELMEKNGIIKGCLNKNENYKPLEQIIIDLNSISNQIANHAYKNLNSADNITVMILVFSGYLYDDPDKYGGKIHKKITRGNSLDIDNFHSTDINYWENETLFDSNTPWEDVIIDFIKPEYTYLFDGTTATGRLGSANKQRNSHECLTAAIFDTHQLSYSDEVVDNLHLPTTKCYIRGSPSRVNSCNDVTTQKSGESTSSTNSDPLLSPGQITKELDDLLFDKDKGNSFPLVSPKGGGGGKKMGFGKQQPKKYVSETTEISTNGNKSSINKNNSTSGVIDDEDLEFLMDDNNF